MRYEYSLMLRTISLLTPISLLYKIFLPLTIWPVFFFLYILKLSPYIQQDIISVGQLQLSFIEACIAPYAYYLLIALIFLTKDITAAKRIKILLLGSLLILAANIVRILLLTLVLLYFGYNAFQSLHIIFWLFISTLYIVFLWLILIKIFKIKSIPVYSDIKYLLQNSFLKS